MVDKVEEVLVDAVQKSASPLSPGPEERERDEQLFAKCVICKSAETCGVRLVLYALYCFQ